MRRRVGTFIAVTALVLTLAAPAGAQQAPTLGAPPQPDVTVQTAQTTDTGGGGLKTWQQALIFAAGIVLIGGIAVAILADARERARRLGHGRDPLTEPADAPHRHKQRSKQRARAKAKAARAQRRRNR
jgi:TRAP-type C4-dicarboxylate transport system permease small subunit